MVTRTNHNAFRTDFQPGRIIIPHRICSSLIVDGDCSPLQICSVFSRDSIIYSTHVGLMLTRSAYLCLIDFNRYMHLYCDLLFSIVDVNRFRNINYPIASHFLISTVYCPELYLRRSYLVRRRRSNKRYLLRNPPKNVKNFIPRFRQRS